MERLLLYLIALYLLFFLWRYVYIFYSYWSTPFARVVFSLQDSLPAEMEYLFATPHQQLAALGFADPLPVLVTNITGQENWSILFRHEAGTTFALVELKTGIDIVMPFSITFYSIIATGDFIMTVNGEEHLILGTLPHTILQDAFSSDLREQWQRHQNVIVSHSADVVKMDSAPFMTRLEAHFGEYFQCLVDTKRLGEAQDSSLRYPTIAGAWQATRNFGRGSQKMKKLRKQLIADIRSGDMPAIDIPVALEAHSFQVMRNLQRRKMNRQWKLWLVFISLGLFLVSFGQLMEPHILLILLVVLFLHEGGHWAAMRLTGYKDMSLFFIPFLGAAVTGVKSKEHVWERMFVLLAGPLPGLILGLGMQWVLATMTVPLWLHEFSFMLIIINLLNLLPLFPLDGGQIVNLLLFARRPYADVIFKLLAVIAFGSAAFWLSDPILAFLALFVALTIRGGFRLARVYKHIDHAELNNDDEDGRIRASFQAIREAGYTQLSFGHKFQLVKGLINRSWHGIMRRRQRLLMAVIYLVILIGSFFFSVFALRGGG